jgi:adhesin/invasin
MRTTRLLSLLALAALGACDDPSSSAPGPPARMDVVSGDLQPQAVVSQELPNPLVVKVVDEDGDPVGGHLVNFVVTAGGGTVFAGAAQTNAQGEARERWTLGPVAGDTQKVEVRAVDATTGQARVFATFRAVGRAGAATRFHANAPAERTGTVGQPLADSIAVTVFDANDNPAPGATVYWAATSGGGSVARATSLTDAQGVARNAWTLGPTAGTQVAQASIQGQPPVSFTAQAAPGAATGVRITPDPVSFNALGQAIPLTVTGTDAFGNPVAGAAVTVVSLNSAIVSLTAPATAVAQANGSTRIVATLQATGAADTVNAVVQQQASSIAITPSPLFLNAGGTATLAAVGQDARGNPVAGTAVTWSTSNAAVATVSANGTVTAHALGTATITAANGAVSGQVQVSVNPVPAHRAATMDVGHSHGCALTAAGEAYCWGDNEFAQLGAGVTNAVLRSSSTPVKVVGGYRFVALAADFRSTCGLTAAGAVYCWGSITASHTPLLVSGNRTYKAIDGHCGITTAGEWHCFSANLVSYTHRAPGKTFATLDGCAISTTAQLYCGDTPAAGVPPVMQVGGGGPGTCALTFSGQAYCSAAFNNNGFAWKHMPSDVPLVEIETGQVPAQINQALPENQVCGLTAQGRTYCGPVAGGLAPWAPLDAYTFVDLAGGGYRLGSHIFGSKMCGITGAGVVYCWYHGTTTISPVPGGMTFATPSNPPAGAAVRGSRR